MTNLVNTTTGTYNLTEIMRQAWQAYDQYNCLGDRSRFAFNRLFFAQMLAAIWKQARKEMKNVIMSLLPAAEKTARREALESQLSGLGYLPLGMNVSRRAAAIQSELASLVA